MLTLFLLSIIVSFLFSSHISHCLIRFVYVIFTWLKKFQRWAPSKHFVHCVPPFVPPSGNDELKKQWNSHIELFRYFGLGPNLPKLTFHTRHVLVACIIYYILLHVLPKCPFPFVVCLRTSFLLGHHGVSLFSVNDWQIQIL